MLRSALTADIHPSNYTCEKEDTVDVAPLVFLECQDRRIF